MEQILKVRLVRSLAFLVELCNLIFVEHYSNLYKLNLQKDARMKPSCCWKIHLIPF